MSLGLVGKKIGMTRVFSEDGDSHPVTVVEMTPNRITQIRTQEIDGYDGIQVTAGTRRPNRVTKPMKGHFSKAGVEAGRGVWEFRVEAGHEYAAGGEIAMDLFEEGQFIDVMATSKGKGFQGGIKRHGFGGGRATHGVSKAHRLPGSIGQNQTPGRVFKGKKMAGHMGATQITQQGLVVLKLDTERNVVLVRGSIPGSKGTDVVITPSIKNKKKSQA
ncbi:MAG: large subunit ribosomal protein L3 [Gammaproteobacteria bacterium]|jgi:large subunit ribosomal protein L3